MNKWERALLRYTMRWMLWCMRFERDMGYATGMNHSYLGKLKGIIRDWERDLRIVELSS